MSVLNERAVVLADYQYRHDPKKIRKQKNNVNKIHSNFNDKNRNTFTAM